MTIEESLNAISEQLSTRSIEDIRKETSQLAALIREKKTLKSAKEAEAKELSSEIEEMSNRLMDLMEHQGFEQFRITGVGLFTKGVERYPRAADPHLLRNYLLENNLSELLTVNAQRLKSFVGTFEEGFDLGSIGISVFEKNKLSVRKA